MKRRIWLIVVMIVLVAGLGYAGFFFFGHDEAGSLTVSEIKSQVTSFDRQLRVEGKVAPGSVDWDSQTQVMRFILTDEKEDLSIVYRGIVPDDFKPGSPVTVEGKYRPDGVFEASGFGSRRSFCAVCH